MPEKTIYDHYLPFMQSREGRVVRILSEFLDAKSKFENHKIQNTIVMFGSARILPMNEAEQRFNEAKKNNEDTKKAQHLLNMSHYYEKARVLAFKLASFSKKFEAENKYYICTGGGPGIMAAFNQGATDAKEKSIGLNILLPFEQTGNPFVTPDLLIPFNYFFMRKFWFSYFAKAFVVFPGGFGTLDEMFEILTLIQTKKMHKKIPIVLFGKEFFNKLMNFDVLSDNYLISNKDKDLFLITDNIDEAYNHITSQLHRLS
ncbi:LOG family protein [Candidatus Hepatincola sp. Pdp]